MTSTRTMRDTRPQSAHLRHQWVGAALVDMGRGGTNTRAERAARSGRYVVPAGIQIDVLEVYCARCRATYDSAAAELPCTTVVRRVG